LKNAKPIIGITFLLLFSALLAIGGFAISTSDTSVQGAYSFYDDDFESVKDISKADSISTILSSDSRFSEFNKLAMESSVYVKLQTKAEALTVFVFSNSLITSLGLTSKDIDNYIIGASIDSDTISAYTTPQHFSSIGGSTLKILTNEDTGITYLNDKYEVTFIDDYINGNLFFIDN
jgi:hypothetical protein